MQTDYYAPHDTKHNHCPVFPIVVNTTNTEHQKTPVEYI